MSSQLLCLWFTFLNIPSLPVDNIFCWGSVRHKPGQGESPKPLTGESAHAAWHYISWLMSLLSEPCVWIQVIPGSRPLAPDELQMRQKAHDPSGLSLTGGIQSQWEKATSEVSRSDWMRVPTLFVSIVVQQINEANLGRGACSAGK